MSLKTLTWILSPSPSRITTSPSTPHSPTPPHTFPPSLFSLPHSIPFPSHSLSLPPLLMPLILSPHPLGQESVGIKQQQSLQVSEITEIRPLVSHTRQHTQHSLSMQYFKYDHRIHSKNRSTPNKRCAV